MVQDQHNEFYHGADYFLFASASFTHGSLTEIFDNSDMHLVGALFWVLAIYVYLQYVWRVWNIESG